MSKEYIIAGNWKMHKTVAECVDFVETLDRKLTPHEKVEVLVFPPFTALYALTSLSQSVRIGAQNMFFEDQGAYTGEISPLMLNGLAEYVLIGHSERRHIFGETDGDLNKKLKAALKHGFKPVFCLGETLEEREGGNTLSVIRHQLEQGFSGLTEKEMVQTVIAYEPVWAIGTGHTATPAQAQEVHEYIRQLLRDRLNRPEDVLILYGGSVKPENSHELLSQKDINGALIGGASLNPDPFFDIITTSFKLVS